MNRRWPMVSGVAVAGALVLALLVWVASLGPGGETVAAAKSFPELSTAQKINRVLARQSKALLAGDRDGYLAGIGDGLQPTYLRRFGSLRAMGIGAWAPTLVDRPSQDADGTWSVMVEHDYCFGQGCTPRSAQIVHTSWRIAGNRATVAKYEPGSDPWDASALRAVTGRRVVVAGSDATAGLLEGVADRAEAAAGVVDRYARWDQPPKWYVVFVADRDEWRSWWDKQDLGPWYDGYSNGAGGVVVQARDAGEQTLLTHELAHVVTIGDFYGSVEQWWLTEGIAEYIADRDGTQARGRLPQVREYVRQGWTGSIELTPPPEGATGGEISARYGIALLAMTCLAKRFGEPRMLEFFGGVVRDRGTPADASAAVFGTPWPGVAQACADEIRNA